MSVMRLPFALAAFALAFAIAGAAWLLSSSSGIAGVRPTVNDVAEGLTCQCGCGLTVANCNHPNCEFSVPVREHIREMLVQGRTRAQIIAFYREKYGEKILSAPTTQGFDLLAWVMPFVAVGIGGLLIGFAARRWRLSSDSAAAAGAADTPGPRVPAAQFDAELRGRLEAELKERR